MEEETGIKDDLSGSEEKNQKEEIFSKVVRAGKRTYFFDVRETRAGDYYLTITESKKRLGKEGKIFYEKHKIFLYKEDFEKFTDGLKKAVDYINNEDYLLRSSPEDRYPVTGEDREPLTTGEFTNVDFDDMGKK